MDRRKLVIVVGALAVLGAGGGAWAVTSSDGDGDGRGTRAAATPASTRSPVPVIVPGRPGESASVMPSGELPAPDGSTFNPADVAFAQMMIPHHRQALEMTALAATRARNPQIRAIADRMSVAQGSEIEVFRAWLRERGQPEEPPGHDHDAMPGMASPGQLAALAGASGDAFDRMFVDLMSAHHQGAIDMSLEVLRTGADERLHELATNIAAEQRIEVGRMRDALAS